MGTVELRNKWKKAIGKVDDRFLRMVDALHETYTNDQVDFFDALPKEIQNLLLESKKDIIKLFPKSIQRDFIINDLFN